MAQCPRSVLLVAYHFPPMGGSGVQRPLKFVRYLPDRGWRPIVLCAGHGRYPLADATLLAEIPAEAHVERHLGWEPAGIADRLGRIGSSVSHFLRGTSCTLNRTATVSERSAPPASQDLSLANDATASGGWGHAIEQRIYWRLQRWAERSPLPEPEWLWARSALRTAERLARRFGVDAVMTSGGPFTTHLIGLWLKRRLGLPWAAEFRDPLIGNFAERPRSPREEAYWRRLEEDVLHTADQVIVTCDDLADDLCARHATLNPAGVTVITNGFDAADFAAGASVGEPRRDSSAEFTLAHVGAFYRDQSIAPILDALRLWLNRRPDWIGRFRFEIVGSLSAEQRRHVRPDDARFVHERGYVTHAEAAAAMCGATALYLTAADAPGGRLCIPAKTFEYLASGRPIFATIPRGTSLERLLHSAGGAYVAAGRTPESLAAELERFCGGVALGVWEGRRRATAVRRFARDELTQRLSEVLEQCVTRDRRGVRCRSGVRREAGGQEPREVLSITYHRDPTATRRAARSRDAGLMPERVSRPPSAVLHPLCHPRAGGNPEPREEFPEPRLRGGNDLDLARAAVTAGDTAQGCVCSQSHHRDPTATRRATRSRDAGLMPVRNDPPHHDIPAPLFIYHAVASDDSNFHDDGYVLRQSLFARHLDVLAREASRVRRSLPLLSFDDGCRSWVDHIAPRLIACDLSAIFFVIADSAARHRGSRATAAPLTWKHLRELADHRRADGSLRFEIGSHGLRHVNLAHLLARRGAKAVLRELTDARCRIEDALSRPVEWLALPGGKAGDDPVGRRTLRQLAGEAGYRRVRDSMPRYDRDPDIDFTGGSPVYAHTTAAMMRFEILRLRRGRWLNAAARGWLRATGRWIELSEAGSPRAGASGPTRVLHWAMGFGGWRARAECPCHATQPGAAVLHTLPGQAETAGRPADVAACRYEIPSHPTASPALSAVRRQRERRSKEPMKCT